MSAHPEQRVIVFTGGDRIQADACWLIGDFSSYTQIILSKVTVFLPEHAAPYLATVLSDILRNMKQSLTETIPSFKSIVSSMLLMIRNILEELDIQVPEWKASFSYASV